MPTEKPLKVCMKVVCIPLKEVLKSTMSKSTKSTMSKFTLPNTIQWGFPSKYTFSTRSHSPQNAKYTLAVPCSRIYLYVTPGPVLQANVTSSMTSFNNSTYEAWQSGCCFLLVTLSAHDETKKRKT